MKKIFEPCFIYNKQCQMGPHLYELHNIKYYQFGACGSCYEGNWDGWNPRHEKKITQHLNEKELKVPNRNEKGYFPRDLPSS